MDVSSHGEPLSRERARRWNRPRFDQTARHPVTCVSIRDAIAYTRWLSQETGHAYRLPSAAEWQYAARAGSTEAQLYIDTNDRNFRNSCGRANLEDEDARRNAITCRDGVRYTTEVGRFAPTPVGLHDMIGNVAELVLACGLTPDGAPENPDGCDPYVRVMGGAWYHAGTPASFSDYATSDWLYAQASRSRYSNGDWNYRRSSTNLGWLSRPTRRLAGSAAMTSLGRGLVNVIPLIGPNLLATVMTDNLTLRRVVAGFGATVATTFTLGCMAVEDPKTATGMDLSIALASLVVALVSVVYRIRCLASNQTIRR